MTKLIRTTLAAALVASSATGVSQAQFTLGPDFVNDYTLNNLFSVPGVPSGAYGGLEFKDGDPNKLLIVGDGETAAAAIYEVDLTRDVDGHVNGFSGTATLVATAPNATGGLQYGPGGVLFYTTYPNNTLGQIKPGSTAPDKEVLLTPLGIGPSTGGVCIAPNGQDLKLTSYDADSWYDADLAADGTGTYDVVNGSFRAFLGSVGPESIIHVDTSYPGFTNESALVCEWFAESIGAYELDASGDAIPGTRRDFLTGASGYTAAGSAIDPLTGDFLFSDLGSVDNILIAYSTAGPLGMNYCGPAIPNSTGLPGIASAFGFPTIGTNDVTLTADQLPPGQFGYFLVGRTQGFFNPPGSSGFICLMGDIGRYNMPPTVPTGQIIVGPTGSLVIDLDDLPTNTPGSQQTLPGETLNFQCWYRDASTSNFTDGVSITFQ
ncbi:MAG: hypothetical protein GY711_25730 [bacterium]|nr:hypothetical protein [bacterium]